MEYLARHVLNPYLTGVANGGKINSAWVHFAQKLEGKSILVEPAIVPTYDNGAAIIEYDGGLPRHEAERLAADDQG